MLILYIKALHIIFIVTWFAGLFYIVRLFIYHVEAAQRPGNEREILQTQYKIMEKRLWYGITWPSMILTLISGFWLAIPYLDELGSYNWLMLKLAFVFGLVLYHLQCGKIFKQLQNDIVKYTSLKLRIWNEGATLLLVAIVFIIILRGNFDWKWGLGGLTLFGVLLLLAIKYYNKDEQKGK